MSTVATEFETAKDLDGDTATALHHLLRAIADSKLLLGYHYGEWTFGTPVLEAAVANCSLAQSELGHLRLLDGILKKFFGDDPDRVLQDRAPEVFADVAYLDQDLAGWTACVAMNAVIDYGLTQVLASMSNSTFRPVRQSVEKMLDEERYHVHHGRGWMRTWSARGDQERMALGREVGTAMTRMVEWLGPANEAEDRLLVAGGIKAVSNREILDTVRSEIEGLGAELGLAPLEAAATDFSSWNGTTRRARPGGPDADILSHLRGDRNDLFKRS